MLVTPLASVWRVFAVVLFTAYQLEKEATAFEEDALVTQDIFA